MRMNNDNYRHYGRQVKLEAERNQFSLLAMLEGEKYKIVDVAEEQQVELPDVVEGDNPTRQARVRKEGREGRKRGRKKKREEGR